MEQMSTTSLTASPSCKSYDDCGARISVLGCLGVSHAEPLKPHDLRDPTISTQIAKRMRELHEGIDLLPLEREDGAFVWQNITKWRKQCEQIVTWLDRHSKQRSDEAERQPFICGTEWPFFFQTVEKYREWLFDQYGGAYRVKQQLVFAHNDVRRLSSHE